jgi:hypothetical protein
MKLDLKSICVFGIVGATLIILNNICKLVYPDAYAYYVISESGMTLSSMLVYSIIVVHYIILSVYLFSKRFVLAGIFWTLQLLTLFWYINFIQSYDPLDSSSFYEAFYLNLQIKSFITIITGAVFIFSLGRKQIWLGVYGFFLILSTLPVFVPEAIQIMEEFYFYMVTLIPVFLIINYYLDFKSLNLDTANSDLEDDVLEPI